MANYLDSGLDADILLLVKTYTDAQTRLLKLIADAQVKGNSTTYYRQVLTSVQEELRVLNEYSRDWANEVIPLTYDAGIEQTYRSYRDANINVSRMVADNDKVQTYIDNIVDPLQEGVSYIGRRIEDELRQIGLESSNQASAAGGASKMTKSIFMSALDEAGITSITDKNGRPIDIRVYADMIARTVPREAANAAALQQVEDIGRDLVQVSTTQNACETCLLYEGRVYSVSGDDPEYPSLMETAFSDGYLTLHPNCTHVLEPYVVEFDKQSEQRKEDSNRPFELTAEDKKMLETYKAQQLVKTQRRNDRKAWEEAKLLAPKNTPKTFSAFRSMKRANSDRYKFIQAEASKAKDIADKISIVQ